MRVHHLNTGTMCPHGRRFVNGTGNPFGRARLICHSLLIELPDGLALVDGGLGTGDLAEPARLGRTWVWQAAPRLDPAEPALAARPRTARSTAAGTSRRPAPCRG